MLTVEEYARIRRAYRDEKSTRAMAPRYRHSRRKIREVLQAGVDDPGRGPRGLAQRLRGKPRLSMIRWPPRSSRQSESRPLLLTR